MTTLVTIGRLLKDCLDGLNEERLKEFQWYLVQIQTDGSRPIPKSKLENATRVETVNKLVEAFGEDGAVEWTVDTLFRMKLNDPASKLIQAKKDQSLEQKEEEPETSSAREKPREVDPTIPTDLSCSICFNLFKDPVVLQCGHSFCQTCVHEYWEKNIVRECSFCKQLIPEGDPLINFSLKSLCENYGGRSQGEPSGHRNHTETFQTPPKNIREKQEALKETKQWCDSSTERIKTQSFNTDKEIMDNLLDKEEETRRSSPLSISDNQMEVKFNDTQQPCLGNPECSTSHQQNLERSPKRRRVEQDTEDGKVSFHDPDNNTSTLTHEGTLNQSPVLHFGDEAEQGRAKALCNILSPSESEEEKVGIEGIAHHLRGILTSSESEKEEEEEEEEDEVDFVKLKPVSVLAQLPIEFRDDILSSLKSEEEEENSYRKNPHSPSERR